MTNEFDGNQNTDNISEEVPKVNPVVLEELSDSRNGISLNELSKVSDVNLNIRVIFSKTRKPLEEMLSYQEGEVVGLNRFAGEAVDVLVNDSIVAKAEITVVDDKFGARLIEIVPSKERLQQIK